MQSFLGQRTYSYAPSAQARMTAGLLSLAICLLIAFMLIWMGLIAPKQTASRARTAAVSFSTDPIRKTGGHHAERRTPPAPPRPVVQQVTQPHQPTPMPRPTVMPPLDLSRKTTDEVSSFDLGKLSRSPGGSAGTAEQTSAAAYGPGEGPGGARLYNAEWYREPSDAEISGYMPVSNIRPEWAMIACRTIERYHVEKCQELGESPRGSGLARAMRKAAWQFLVRPPRIDGKPVIGAWVRIRIVFTKQPDAQEASDDRQ